MADWQATLVSGLWADLIGWESVPLAFACLMATAVFLAWLSPRLALRLGMTVLGRSWLWLSVKDRHLFPRSGPVLLVCNPLSYLGWLIVLLACPRHVRFVILAGWTDHGLTGWLLRRAGAITLKGTDQAALEQTLVEAGDALARGEVVCLFAEGCRTADGAVLPYHRVFQQVASRHASPVVPVSLHQPHGSLLSMHEGKLVRKMPPEWPSPVWVRFGEPMPAGTTAGQARQALQELSARLAIERGSDSRPIHRQFVRMATRHPFRTCWIDSTAPGQEMNYAKAYVGSVCLAGLLRPILGDEAMVGVWLPPGRGGALTNVALALLGKTSVNLNYTAGAEAIQSALRQCQCKHVVTARRFTARLAIDPGPGVEIIYLEDLLPKVTRGQKLQRF